MRCSGIFRDSIITIYPDSGGEIIWKSVKIW